MSNQNSKLQKPEKSTGDQIDIDGNVSKSVIVTGSGNTLNFDKKNKQDKPKKKNILITVTWISFAATILAALIMVN